MGCGNELHDISKMLSFIEKYQNLTNFAIMVYQIIDLRVD
ncbi:hypothetical protein GCM10007971_36650 [Oceanobacillus indicireducens]|uniref:Uncharacterized protein n=1 Tax=Oceanobacillus indicireducens TaxID=1004261 RepID=A0A917Y5T0_9BACI|nr:hypothetical protein GCM10007971_36650 [Oceanobacillus indicireducens]